MDAHVSAVGFAFAFVVGTTVTFVFVAVVGCVLHVVGSGSVLAAVVAAFVEFDGV